MKQSFKDFIKMTGMDQEPADVQQKIEAAWRHGYYSGICSLGDKVRGVLDDQEAKINYDKLPSPEKLFSQS